MRVFPDPAALGEALAREIVAALDEARRDGRPFVLGCPSGRTPRSTYQALAWLVAGLDLGHVVIAMMDEYVRPAADGAGFEAVSADAHYSCRRFAGLEIVGALNEHAAVPIPPDHLWLPDPADPPAYTRRLADVGGIDHFIVASGASDGHVAFVKPGAPLDSAVSIVELAESTRRDNLATFPRFTSLEEVPRHGISLGLGTIAGLSRRVTLVIHGADKRQAAARVLAATDHETDWPATFIHRCPGGRIWVDRAAAARDQVAARDQEAGASR